MDDTTLEELVDEVSKTIGAAVTQLYSALETEENDICIPFTKAANKLSAASERIKCIVRDLKELQD
jgi:hypothetical protein